MKTDKQTHIGFLFGMEEQHVEWFETWFDTPYYHLLYRNRSDNEAQLFISKLAAYLNLPASSSIWDLACGKGRHSVSFNKLGFHVVGTDLSLNSIRAAQQNENDTLSFYQLDMRSVFRINYFDLVVNLFTSFGYFSYKQDDLKVLKSVSVGLKSNGLFIIDYLNKEFALNNLDQITHQTIGEVKFNTTKQRKGDSILKTIEVIDGFKTELHTETVKLFELNQLIDLAALVNLEPVSYFGDYELNPFDEKESPRMIILFRKK